MIRRPHLWSEGNTRFFFNSSALDLTSLSQLSRNRHVRTETWWERLYWLQALAKNVSTQAI